MNARAVLRSHQENLKLYREHFDATKALQQLLIDEIAPGILDECEADPDTAQWLQQWLHDTPSIFRTLKRHDFISSLALEDLQETLSWRLETLRYINAHGRILLGQCLPSAAVDPFGRPIVVFKLASLTDAAEDIRSRIIITLEYIRMHLAELSSSPDGQESLIGPFQFVALVDIKDTSLKVFNPELISWYINEVSPRYPGLLAAVFILNYTWTHYGIWSMTKRLLPASAFARVNFPTRAELFQFFSPDALPRDYGGNLPPFSELDDPLCASTSRATCSLPRITMTVNSNPSISTNYSPSPQPNQQAPSISLSRTSLLNPFFGYPTLYKGGTAIPYSGRRRKRDLFRTLVQLWWHRWRKRVILSLLLVLVMLAARRKVFGMRWRWPQGILAHVGVPHRPG